jgi:type I restriction enzyme S subunit
MPNDGWRPMSFTDAVSVNPHVPLKKGTTYPFVEMAAVDPDSRSVHESEHRLLDGGGSRFAAGDTLMARITPCLENGKIARFRPIDTTSPGFGSTEFIVIRGRSGVTDNDFAYYLTKWPAFRQFAISQMTGSSGRQRVPAESLSHFEVVVPPIGIQRRIAAILGSLDDKIELNRRMNRTLERMAQALFKSWFIDYGPVRAKAAGDPTAGGLPAPLAALFPDRFTDSPLGPIPEGWEVQSLDGIADYLNGLACQKYPAVEGKKSLPVIKIRELRQGITENSDRATAGVAPKYIIEDGDILFSWSGSLLVTIWCNGRGVLNQHVFKVTSAKYPKWYYYHATKHHLEEFQRIAADKATTMGHIQRHHLTNAKLAVPPEGLMVAATDVLGTAIDRRINALRQARTLARLRDTLLPKLLSGEVEVSEAEAAVEEVR